MTQKTSAARRFYLLSGAVSMFFAGIIYAWSILKSPLGDEFGWTASQLALNFTLTLCFFCIGGLLAGQTTRRVGPRLPMLLAAALVFCGFFLCSRLSESIIRLYIYYAFLCGTGIGMAYNIVISSTNAWFPDKTGTSSGVLMMSFGFSSLILGKAASALFTAPDFGWRKTFIVLGAVISAVLAIAAFIVRKPSAETQLPKPSAKKKIGEKFQVRDLATTEMIRRPSFWCFFAFSILNAAVGSTVISFARDFTMSVGAGAALAASLVGLLSVFNGLGRILCGLAFDIAGRRRTMLITSTITLAAAAALLLAVLNHSLTMGILGLCLAGLGYGAGPTMSSVFVGDFYGTAHFSGNYSVANTMLIPSSFAATFAGVLLTQSGSYAAVFIMLLGCAAAALALTFSINKP